VTGSACCGHVALLPDVTLEKGLTCVSKHASVWLVTLSMCEEYRSCHWRSKFSFLVPFLNSVKCSGLSYSHPNFKAFVLPGWYSGPRWIWEFRNELIQYGLSYSEMEIEPENAQTKRSLVISLTTRANTFYPF